MTDQPKAEPQVGEGEKESPKNFDEAFDTGWKQYEEEMSLAAPPAKTEPKPVEKSGEKPPYKVLKVGGKEVPVYSKQELAEKIAEMYGDEDKMVDLGQLSQDYTRKRQADAADRKKWEETFQGKAEELNAMGRRYSEIVARLRAQGIEINDRGEPVVTKGAPAPKEKGEETRPSAIEGDLAETYKRYNLDPEFAQDHEKALIQDVHEMRKVVNQMQSALESSSKAINFFQVREVVQEMARVIDDERKASPFEDIIDESGKSLTLQEFQNTIQAKAQADVREGKKLDLDRLTRETIREISTKQAKAKESVTLTDEMSPEDFYKKYPKLAAKLGKAAGAEALDKHTEKESKVPPTLDRRSKEVDLKRQPTSDKGPRGMESALEAAFSDPDILKSIQG